MIELYINNKLVDISNSFTDIRLEKDYSSYEYDSVGEFSYEIDLPITDRNREIFDYINVFDVSSKFGKVYDAILTVNDITILKGKFLLVSITKDVFSGNLYVPSRKSLKDVLGDKKMSEITEHNMYVNTWSDIDSINTPLISSRDNAHIAFPYILYRLPYNISGSSYDNHTQDLAASGNTFTVDNIFPVFNVLSVIKDCFTSEGYTIEGSIFNKKKFKELFMTPAISYDDYKIMRQTPYYVSFSADYSTLRNGELISSTLQTSSLFGSDEQHPSMRFGTDAILLSDNTIIYDENDDYNMLVKGSASNARTLVVPKSGWYRIATSGTMLFPYESGNWGELNKTNVAGCYSDADRCDLSQNIFEFQVKKTSTPLSNPNIYSMNLSVPMVPTNISRENVTSEALGHTEYGIVMSYDQSRNKYARNQGVALVKDYSSYDTSDFVCGSRLGCQYSYPRYSGSRTPDRQSYEMVFTCLPDPTKANVIYGEDAAGIENYIMRMYDTHGIREDDSDSYRWDYGTDTAQVLLRDDSYSNFNGYNKIKYNSQSDSWSWDTNRNEERSYSGMTNSYARTINKRKGEWYIDTCVWLEEGDTLSFEMMMPFSDVREECGWLESCDWKHREREGVLATNVNMSFKMAIVTSDEKWAPSNENPVPSFNELKLPKMTNVNKWLGDGKVNDFIENFVNTFNLKLTRVDNTTYSLDTISDEANTYGEIINVDDMCHVSDATFKRIERPSKIGLQWNISTSEEGYVRGNNTKVNKKKRDLSGYTGSYEKENSIDITSNENITKSDWSYTWVKVIDFVNGDSIFQGGRRNVPIIADATTWDRNYINISGIGYASDKTSRLIYLDLDPDSDMVDFFNVRGYVNDTDEDEFKAKILFCGNSLAYSTPFQDVKTFRLDYDNSESNSEDECITDVFFKFDKDSQYVVELPVTLSNDIYSRIKANTLISFNNGLFRILGIEGHDVSLSNNATLKMISL